MSSKLSIYNNALVQHLGARRLSSLSENRPSRKHLDAVWDGEFVKRILEMGQWNQAIRTIESTYDPDYTPSFGFQYAHTKPDDWVRTVGLSLSEFLTPPLDQYEDENGFWVCNHPTIYIRYISSDSAYGGDIGSWPESVASYAEVELAARSCKAITGDESLAASLMSQAKKMRIEAKSVDQMNQPSRKPPLSSWATARLGSRRRARNSGVLG